jgi:hypothetical protein
MKQTVSLLYLPPPLSALLTDSLSPGAENAQRLLAESTARFKRRRELVAKKTALLKGKSYVIEFQRKCETDDLLPGSGGSSGYSSPDHVVLTPSVDAMDLE